jgi:mannose-1-phosphate guanylyltransferase
MASVIVPVILAGGSGLRLWPMSTAERPKHLHSLIGEGSLFAQTIARVSDRQLFQRPLVVCSLGQTDEIRNFAGDAQLIIEPLSRNSAPAIALASAACNRESLLLILPSDHHISDLGGFFEAIERGRGAAQEGWIVTFGIKPDRAETGYGYIALGKRQADGVFKADRFIEKPDLKTAQRMVEGGQYSWNAGIFLARAGTLLDELNAHNPEIAQVAEQAMAAATQNGRDTHPNCEIFARSPAISIDYAVMEHSNRVAVVPVEMGWSDIGSWAAIQDVNAKDKDDNTIGVGCMAIDSQRCLIKTTGPRVAAIGLENIIIVATDDEVLVTSRDHAQSVADAARWSKAQEDQN